MLKRIFALLIAQTVLLLALPATGANTRLAIGTFGLASEQRDGQLADLVAARLSAAPGFELVERRELNAVLKEAGLGLAGVVRAKDAVRVGALLRADQFLLGSFAPINGTNRIFIRLVDAKTGVIRGICVFRDTQALDSLAGEVADFVLAESKQSAQRRRDYLAIGVVQNLGVNNRFADFPAQMRGSVAAGLGGKVTVLERDVVSFLADEVRLDQAGLTAGGGGHVPQMQFGFWIVDGFFQSYEVAEPVVELKLRVERVQGGQKSLLLQGKPDDQFLAKICDSITAALNHPEDVDRAVPPTREGEIAALAARGNQLVDYKQHFIHLPRTIQIPSAPNEEKKTNAVSEATRLFESILLLDPDNNAAKMRLAGCLMYEDVRRSGLREKRRERMARAREYYREVIAAGDREYADDARISLALACDGIEDKVMLGQFSTGLAGLEMLDRFATEATDPKLRFQFRWYRSLMLQQVEYAFPLATVMPYMRKQLMDELTDVQDATKDSVNVSFDAVLFDWRSQPTNRTAIINVILPELIEKFPDLKPYLLLQAAGEQTTANSPVTAQFLADLGRCEQHPETVWHAPSYFKHLSSTLEEEKDAREHGGCTLYQRMVDNHQYATVVAVARARQRAAARGLAPPLTTVGKMRLAESLKVLQHWQEALDLFNELPDVPPQLMDDCRSHLSLATAGEAPADFGWQDKNDAMKVQIACQCMDRRQWSTAVAILESIGRRTVRMGSAGPWGEAFAPVLPAVLAGECRAKAGMPAVNDPMRFELGDTPYVNFKRDGYGRYYSFQVEGEDLWIAVLYQIKRFSGPGPFGALQPVELHEFEKTLRTRSTDICVSGDYIWGGTYGEGLLELDRRTGVCRRLTMDDGLLLNRISCLRLQGQTLWIAYRNGDSGAVGTLDLKSRKFSSLTSKLSPGAGGIPSIQSAWDDPHQAPQHPVVCMTETEPSDLWFMVSEKGLQRLRSATGSWDTFGQLAGENSPAQALAADPVRGRLLLAKREQGLDRGSGEKSRTGGLLIYDYRQNKADLLQIYQGLPSNDVTAVAVDGRFAWIGGRGFVAVVDVEERKVVRIAYVSAARIFGIQLSKAHAWIQVSCGEMGDTDYAGTAWTGVYRLDRAAVEPVVLAASTQRFGATPSTQPGSNSNQNPSR